MMSSLPSFESCIVTRSKENDSAQEGKLFILSPPSSSSFETPQEVAQFVKECRAKIDESLTKHGAILFRGFPLESPDDFNTFVRAFDGWKDLSYDRSMSFAVRKRLTDRICTTNEGKVCNTAP
jgi:hypothetical protein